ncbi:unnamed protein product [Symbiodinium sp. CCMP2592]|nr:unnamed protein product [Symbiodinium sp. CCMP2592]
MGKRAAGSFGAVLGADACGSFKCRRIWKCCCRTCLSLQRFSSSTGTMSKRIPSTTSGSLAVTTLQTLLPLER